MFHRFFNLAFKVKKFAMYPNQVLKICNVAIPLDDSVFPDGYCRTCGARVIFGLDFTKMP
jgi:hypothetical protein